MVDRAHLQIGSVVRLNSGSIKFTVENIRAQGNGHDVHLIGWGDRVGLVRFVAKLELLCWPRPAEEREPATPQASVD